LWKKSVVPNGLEDEWVPEPVRMLWERKNLLLLPRLEFQLLNCPTYITLLILVSCIYVKAENFYLLLLSLLFLFLITKKLLNSNKSFLMPYLNESTIEKQNMSATNLEKRASCILLLPYILSQLIHEPTNTLNIIHNK